MQGPSADVDNAADVTVCADMNECEDYGSEGLYDVNADCVNKWGESDTRCRDGFTGDGLICEGISTSICLHL